MLIIIFANRSKKIDAQQLFDIEFAGPDGYGKVYAQLDIDPEFAYSEYDVYMDDYSITIVGEDRDDVEYSDYFSDKRSTLEDTYGVDKSEAKDMRDALLDTDKNDEFKLTCTASKETGLSNGDTVTFEVEYDEEDLEEKGIKLTNTTFEVTVSGLDEATSLDDPFDGLAITYSGTDGNGELTYNSISSKYDFIYYYNNSSSYYLTEGDTVTFEAELVIGDYEYLDEDDASKGYWFYYDGSYYIWPFESYSTTKDFTVEGLTALTEIDPFEGVTFSYSYGTPFLSITDVYLSEDLDEDIADEISISIDQDYGERYDVGDTFTVKVYAYSSLADLGYKISGTADSDGYYTKEFTVDETAPAYIDADTAASADTAYTEKYENAVTDCRQELDGKWIYTDDVSGDVESIDSFEFLKSYVITNDATDYDNIGWSECVCRIAKLYKAKVTLDDDDSTSVNLYIVFYADDVIIDGDGTVNTDNNVDYVIYTDKDEALADYVTGMEGYTSSTVSGSSE